MCTPLFAKITNVFPAEANVWSLMPEKAKDGKRRPRMATADGNEEKAKGGKDDHDGEEGEEQKDAEAPLKNFPIFV